MEILKLKKYISSALNNSKVHFHTIKFRKTNNEIKNLKQCSLREQHNQTVVQVTWHLIIVSITACNF